MDYKKSFTDATKATIKNVGKDTTRHIPHLTNINIKDNTEEPMKFIKRIAKERE